jgi:hypothetical protein
MRRLKSRRKVSKYCKKKFYIKSKTLCEDALEILQNNLRFNPYLQTWFDRDTKKVNGKCKIENECTSMCSNFFCITFFDKQLRKLLKSNSYIGVEKLCRVSGEL